MTKKNIIEIDLNGLNNIEEVYFKSAVDKINNGALTQNEINAIVAAASIEGANAILNKIFDGNNAAVLSEDALGNVILERLWAELADDTNCAKKKHQNIFKRLWNKLFKKN
jgi:hypothetical protein